MDFAKRTDKAVVNTLFQKEGRALGDILYEPGEILQIELCRRGNLKKIGDCKVIPWESVAGQHRIAVCKMCLKRARRKRVVAGLKIRWWKINEA